MNFESTTFFFFFFVFLVFFVVVVFRKKCMFSISFLAWKGDIQYYFYIREVLIGW